MYRERDQQRSRVYKSDEHGAPLPKVVDIERFVLRLFNMVRFNKEYGSAVCGDKWKRPSAISKYPTSAPVVYDGRGRSRAGGWSRGITMPIWSRDEGIVLHELAHTINIRMNGPRVSAHGWQYCAIYLKITLYMRGRQAHDELKAAFKTNRVRYTAPRKGRKLTPEQRAAAIARLSVYNGTAATECLNA